MRLVNPNETAYEALKDAENIRRDAERRERQLQPYTGEDEDTARHDIGPRFVTENHIHLHSQPDAEPDTPAPEIAIGPAKVSGPKWLIAVLALLVAAGTAIVAHFVAK